LAGERVALMLSRVLKADIITTDVSLLEVLQQTLLLSEGVKQRAYWETEDHG
jgi:hypothetical protein